MADHPPVQIAANDFKRQWHEIQVDTLDAVDRVGRSGWLVLGQEVQAFEAEFAEWWGMSFAVGVASGLDALEIGMRCAGIEPGARVLTTPFTAFATTLAVLRTGAEPVWCDVDDNGGLDLERVDAALQADSSIRAVLPVHLYGHPLDPVELQGLASHHGVAVIEDCAQSAGAKRGDKPTGAAGLAAGTSLYPTKNLGALGDGGVLLTDDEEVAARARRLRDYGQRTRYEHVEPGLNSRLDELHAAILRSALLPRLDRGLLRRQEIAERYREGLAPTSMRPIDPSGGRSAHHLFAVEVVEGDPRAVERALIGAGVQVGRHYPFVCPDQPAAAGRGSVLDPLATARRLAEGELSLPIHPYLSDQEVELVIAACKEVSG